MSSNKNFESKSKRPRSGRGQVIVVACLTMLLLAFLMLSSFSLSNAIHERIRLQSNADATAYSVAVIEARAMNIVAYKNRAFMAVVVAMGTAHGWNTLANAQQHVLRAARNTWQYATTNDSGQCKAHCSILPPCCSCSGCFAWPLHVACLAAHFEHQLAIVAQLPFVVAAEGLIEDEIRDYDDDFNTALRGLAAALKEIERSQRGVLSDVYDALGQVSAGSNIYEALAESNGFDRGHLVDLAAKNQPEFACALTGAAPAMACPPAFRPPAPEPTRRERSAVARSAADAARSQFEADCNNEVENVDSYDRAKQWNVFDEATTATRRRCAAALGALGPDSSAETKNFFAAVLVTIPSLFLDCITANRVWYKMPLRVGGFEDGINWVTDQSPLERIVGVTERNRSDIGIPIVTTFVLEFHDEKWIPPPDEGDTRTVEGGSKLPPDGGWNDSNPLGPWDEGIPSVMPKIEEEYWSWKGNDQDTWSRNSSSYLASSETEFKHIPGDGHQGGQDHVDSKTHFNGICNANEADSNSVCFVGFRSDDRVEYDYGQPSVYQGLKSPLSLTPKPWELNATGTASVHVTGPTPTKLKLKPRYGASSADTAFAVSKAKVYFHEFGNPYAENDQHDWRRPPNLFDPFWRSKLHPFRAQEKIDVLNAAGDSDGVRVVTDVKVNVASEATGERE